ncbi:hypothetical protein [Abyssisolibacter fermentans]|uniref:hypothetical protein n=1 Tax=Abyssisolibacter fermentans TaxID=1766203 RepID=UPI00082C9629|nr:hypothetical protein [Abyssisolibacter fermentans]
MADYRLITMAIKALNSLGIDMSREFDIEGRKFKYNSSRQRITWKQEIIPKKTSKRTIFIIKIK